MDNEELRRSIIEGQVVDMGGYPYLVTPLADGIPRIDPELLGQAAETLMRMSQLDCDLILAPEAMGIPMATAISLRSGLPFAVIRKRRYNLPGEIAIEQRTGYSRSRFYVNGTKCGDRVAIVDDLLDTGNTLRSLVEGLRAEGVDVTEILVTFNRNNDIDALSNELDVPIRRILDISVKDGLPEILRPTILKALRHHSATATDDMHLCRRNRMDPILLATCLAMTLIGCLMGTFSGIVPGIHVNTLASMLLASYPVLEGALPLEATDAAIAVSCCVMSASVVHSFVDFVPSVFIGAPDEGDAVSVLPGHHLLKQGRGMEAVRAAAIGSLIGCSASILMAVPLQYALEGGGGELLDRLTPVVLIAACFAVLYGEWIRGNGIWGPVAFLLSGALGYACMTLPIPQDGIFEGGSIMMPLLTGLFGIPVMLESSKSSAIPVQTDRVKDPVGLMPGLRGVAMGTLAGWFPGITSSVGAAMSAAILPENRPERFISTVASIGTVTSVLALVTLSVSGNGRSGTALVMKEILGDSLGGVASGAFLVLLLSTAMASALGYHITIACGKVFCRISSGIDPRRLSRTVLILLVALTAILTGPWGLVVLLCSATVGLIPSACGTGRLALCGCLILPVLVFKLLRSQELGRCLGHELLDIDYEPLVHSGPYLALGITNRDGEHEPPAVHLREFRLASHRHPHRSSGSVGHIEVRPYGACSRLEKRSHAFAGGLLDESDHGRGGEHREGSASDGHSRVGLRDLDRSASPDSFAYHKEAMDAWG